MRVLWSGLLAGFLLVSAGQAATIQSSTIRYSFDVVSVTPKLVLGMWFERYAQEAVMRETSPYQFEEVTDATERASVIAAHHPFAHLVGQQFSVVLEVSNLGLSPDRPIYYDTGRLGCISGPICDVEEGLGRFNIYTSWEPYFETGNPRDGFINIGGDGVKLDRSSLSMEHDVGTARLYRGSVDGQTYAWEGAYAYFDIENLRVSTTGPITLPPVPLPASAVLLGAGLIPLALLRRRQRG
jgi:hypothetical protein